MRDASVNAVSEGRTGLDAFCSSEGETANCDILGLNGGERRQVLSRGNNPGPAVSSDGHKSHAAIFSSVYTPCGRN